MLPDIDGWEIYHQMKADAELSTVPVIIVSAKSPEQDAAEGNRVVGDDRFISKPFEVMDLINTVYEVLDRHPVSY